MSFLKRHWWWVLVLGTTAVLMVVGIVLSLLLAHEKSRNEAVINNSLKALRGVKQFYTPEAAKKAAAAAEYRDQQFKDIQKYVEQPKSAWDVLVPEVFPVYNEEKQRRLLFEFRSRYVVRLQSFMPRMNAGDPELLSGGVVGVALFAKAPSTASAGSFYWDSWIPTTAGEPPHNQAENQTALRESQDNLWLQEDIVDAIKRTNDLWFKSRDLSAAEQTVANSVVKELHEIVIGRAADEATGGGGGRSFASSYSGESTRYRFVGSGTAPGGLAAAAGRAAPEAPGVRAPVPSGLASNNNGGRFLVLPFKLTVTADGGNYLELVRQIGGTRSFITVENVDYTILPETESGVKTLYLTQAGQRSLYGPRALATVVIRGTSLIFEAADKDGGRPTLPPTTATAAAGTSL
jgi:hypothetical protein